MPICWSFRDTDFQPVAQASSLCGQRASSPLILGLKPQAVMRRAVGADGLALRDWPGKWDLTSRDPADIIRCRDVPCSIHVEAALRVDGEALQIAGDDNAATFHSCRGRIGGERHRRIP